MLNLTTTVNAGIVTLSLADEFMYEDRLTFFKGINAALEAPDIRIINIEMSALKYLDSSALGMLLIGKDKAEQKGIQIYLCSPSQTTFEILKVANFQEMFEIKEAA